MKLRLFDTHCHLNAVEFDRDREVLLTLARRIGVAGILVPGTTRHSWRRIRQLVALYSGVHAALGLHPMFMKEHRKEDLRALELAVATPPIKAVGEIGLDFYVDDADRRAQVNLFHAQLQIANAARLPVVLHVRKAHEEVLKHLRMVNFKWGGFCHAFNGSMEQAKRYVDMGFKLGFGGACTYPRAAKLRTLVQELPLTDIVLETDAPDMKPVTCQTSRNTPVHVLDIFRSVCELRSESPGTIAEQTFLNACEVLSIDPDAVPYIES
jgi:TatD DNase family protein